MQLIFHFNILAINQPLIYKLAYYMPTKKIYLKILF